MIRQRNAQCPRCNAYWRLAVIRNQGFHWSRRIDIIVCLCTCGESFWLGFGIYVCDGRVGIKMGRKEGRRNGSSFINFPQRFDSLLKLGLFLNQHVLFKSLL